MSYALFAKRNGLGSGPWLTSLGSGGHVLCPSTVSFALIGCVVGCDS